MPAVYPFGRRIGKYSNIASTRRSRYYFCKEAAKITRTDKLITLSCLSRHLRNFELIAFFDAFQDLDVDAIR